MCGGELLGGLAGRDDAEGRVCGELMEKNEGARRTCWVLFWWLCFGGLRGCIFYWFFRTKGWV